MNLFKLRCLVTLPVLLILLLCLSEMTPVCKDWKWQWGGSIHLDFNLIHLQYSRWISRADDDKKDRWNSDNIFSMHFRLCIVHSEKGCQGPVFILVETVVKNLGTKGIPKRYNVKWIWMNYPTSLIHIQNKKLLLDQICSNETCELAVGSLIFTSFWNM